MKKNQISGGVRSSAALLGSLGLTARKFACWPATAVLLCAVPLSAHAQLNTATLQGTATDSSGAAIPQAQVTVTDVDTGAARTTQTDGSGNFSVPSLQPGNYTVTAAKTGFTTTRQTGIKLDVGGQLKLPLVLQPGSTTETVTVQAASGEIPATDVTLGTVIEQKQVVDLPLNGRQFSQLIQLEPGVVPVDNSQSTSKTANFGAGASNPSVNGQSNRSNLYFIDGAIDSDPYFGGFSFSPSVDLIQEFKAESHTDQAEFGLATGAIVNVVTRSGTNQFHGTVFEFNRNTIFNTQIRNFSTTPQPKLPYHLNQFGGSVGGPILRNKLFFFANYEGGRQAQPSPTFYTVPTAAERAGDFSGVLPGGVSPTIYDPATYNPTTGTEQPFAGNIIPMARLNQGMLTYLNATYPLPNTANPNAANNLYTTTGNITTADQGSVRIDYALGQKDSIEGRYSRNATTVSVPGTLNESFVTGFNGQNTAGSWTHTYGPSLISQVTVAYNTLTIPQGYVIPGVNQASLFTQAGLGAGFTATPGGIPDAAIPSLGLSGGSYAGLTTGDGPVGPENIFQASGSVSKTLGKHFLRFGSSFFHTGAYDNFSSDGFTFSNRGTWNAACQFTSTPDANCPTFNANAGDLGAGGDPIASMLLGLPISATRNVGYTGIQLEEKITSLFAQDTWSPTQRLTVTYGLRWDYNSPITDANNRMATYDVATRTFRVVKNDIDLPSGPLPAHVVVTDSESNTPPHYTYFQPRLGISYQFTPQTTLRAGVGRTFDDWALPSTVASLSHGSWPSGYGEQAGTQNLNQAGISLKPDGTPVTAQNPFSGPLAIPASPFPLGGDAFEDPSWQPASEYQWNLGIEQLIGRQTTFRIGYVGSETEHNFLLNPYNVALPSTNAVKVYPDPIFGAPGYEFTDHGTASYHALQTQLARTFSNGLEYNASFTWSKALALASCGNDYYQVCIQNPHNPAADHGRTSLDVPYVFTFNTAYELPVGKGKPYLNTGVPSYILGNWQVNAIASARSGTTINPTNGQNNDQANVGGGLQRVNFVGDPNNGAPHKIGAWFNPTAFQLPAFGTYGDAPIDSLRGPNYWDIDFSLFKNVPIHENIVFQFRVETFDVLNHPNLANPDGSFAGTTTASNGSVSYNNGFNTITSTVPNSNRVIQLAGKLNF